MGQLQHVFVLGEDQPAIAVTAQHLGGIEGKGRGVAHRTGGASLVGGALCLRHVFQHLEAVGLGDGEDVRPYVLGYTCVNDVTARDLQKKDGQWTRGKGFDTFCPVGPLVTDEIDPWTGIGVETRVNGEVRQQGNTRNFIFALDVAIRYISQVMTLLPGDVIATGTPAGVGPLNAGDVVEVVVSGVGTLRNPVIAQGS